MAGFEHFLVRNAMELVREFNFSEPLHRWLATKFRENKKWGSRDRRGIRDLVYQWYRLGKCVVDLPEEQRLQLAVFLCNTGENALAEHLLQNTDFHPLFNSSLEEKIAFVKTHDATFDLEGLFPFTEKLSEGVDLHLLQLSLLQQPLVWIRIRKQYTDRVRSELKENKIAIVKEVSTEMVGLPQTSKLDTLNTYTKGFFEVQDLSSQQTAEFYQPFPNSNWYDCCAGSGGKSLALLDIDKTVKLTVSDIRKTTLQNLEERFKRNGYKLPEMFTADLTQIVIPQLTNRLFDGVLADVPCSGSGTWSRTPELISSFDPGSIADFTILQKSIAKKAGRHLKSGGVLIYMTCSVFAAENEDIVAAICAEDEFKCEAASLLQGAAAMADTLYVARLVKK